MLRKTMGLGFLLCLTTSAHAAVRTWGFDDGTLQGWQYVNLDGEVFPVGNPAETGVGWKVSIDDVALGEMPDWFLLQGSTVDGVGTAGVNNHPDYYPAELGTRSPNYRVIPEPFDNRDCVSLQCQTQIFQSPVFRLDDSGPISVDIMGGQAQGRVFDPDVDIPPGWPEDHGFYKDGSGWQGFALYDVAADEYVRWGFPTFNNDGKVRDGREVWETVTIPAEELATLANDGKDYRLDIFDSFSGGWGWIGFDTVRVPDADVPFTWTRGSDDNLWTNPANWDNGVPTGNEVHVNGPAAGAPNGPVIEDGMEAVAGILISDGGTATMTMTGGTLELTDWGMWWGDAEGANATFFMSGGTIDYTGSPGIMEMAWQPDDAPVGSSVGIWNMTGGEVHAKGIDIPGDGEDGNPGRAEINLDGGVINVGTERGGLMMYEGAVVNITEGQFLLEGDQEEQVQTYIDNGWITAYGSNPNAELVLGYDATQNLTFLSAIIESLTDCNSDGSINVQDANCTPLDQLDDFLASLDPPSLRGDADGDGEVQFTDFVILSNNFGNPGDYTSGDFDKDGVVQFSDFVILSSNFGQTGGAAALASVPEPSGLLWFGLGGLLTGLVRRRRWV